ncbi:hypothetical protein CDAR_384391 [Caerostris darwini]|uniref:Secreted protein n=1 Tax=Caerostris darwini TaxID=1538125 RepID=A0AAV4M565_9ARAC|nr:hypothetical protein CDAR_384391 [Caerostris darwini]
MGLIFAAAQIMIAAKTCVAPAEVCTIFENLFMNLRRQGKLENTETETHTKGYLAFLTMRWNCSSSKFCMILATQLKCVLVPPSTFSFFLFILSCWNWENEYKK